MSNNTSNTSNTIQNNYKQQYKEEEIYISKTIIKFDEYGNVISRNTFYDKEIIYSDKIKNIRPIQPTANTYQNYTQPYTQHYTQPQSVSSTHTSPPSSVPTSPTSLDSVFIDMSNISMYHA